MTTCLRLSRQGCTAGIRPVVDPDGLRKTAARKLAEAGCSEEEIKSVTGHTTSQMVSHYTKQASKRKLSSAAIHKLENSK
jgi:integrase